MQWEFDIARRIMMRCFLFIGLVITSFFSNAFAQSEEDMRFFRIGTGGIAGTYYPIGGIISYAVSNPPGNLPCQEGGNCGPEGLVMIPQTANGSVSNAKHINQGRLESGFVQSDIAYWAYTGTGKFNNQPPNLNLRSITSLYSESIHVVARKGAGIKTIRDLVGKRVSIDEPGSGTLIDAEIVLNEYGISREDFKVEFLKPDLAIQRIRENKLDAFFIVAGYPTKAVSLLAKDTSVILLSIDGPEADRLVSSHRFFTRSRIPSGVYHEVEGVPTLNVGAQWIVGSSTDANLVYEITKTLWSDASRKLLDGGHEKGRNITLDTALDGVAVPLHPGAMRYYSEIGLIEN